VRVVRVMCFSMTFRVNARMPRRANDRRHCAASWGATGRSFRTRDETEPHRSRARESARYHASRDWPLRAAHEERLRLVGVATGRGCHRCGYTDFEAFVAEACDGSARSEITVPFQAFRQRVLGPLRLEFLQ